MQVQTKIEERLINMEDRLSTVEESLNSNYFQIVMEKENEQ